MTRTILDALSEAEKGDSTEDAMFMLEHAADLIAVARAAQDFTWRSVHDHRERDLSEARMMDALAPLLADTTEAE